MKMEVLNLGEMNYDGSQLHHALAYEKKKVLGPSICYFIGNANVKDHLVDLEDSLADDFIKSERMAHFIIEIPNIGIQEAVVWQRFFIQMAARFIECYEVLLTIDGDDLTKDDRKLSVSIATLSRFSGLIHVGINIIVGEGCPVPAVGLSNLGVFDDPFEHDEFSFCHTLSQDFANEFEDIVKATYKVIEVS